MVPKREARWLAFLYVLQCFSVPLYYASYGCLCMLLPFMLGTFLCLCCLPFRCGALLSARHAELVLNAEHPVLEQVSGARSTA